MGIEDVDCAQNGSVSKVTDYGVGTNAGMRTYKTNSTGSTSYRYDGQ